MMPMMLKNNWKANKINIDTAFLCRDLEEKIYTKIHDRYYGVKYDDKDVLKLVCSI